MQVVEPASLKDPEGQVEQYVLPSFSEALPLSQEEHVCAPDNEYVPASQIEQVVALSLTLAFPAAQFSHWLTPPSENVEARQSTQEVEPEVAWERVPGSHEVQAADPDEEEK